MIDLPLENEENIQSVRKLVEECPQISVRHSQEDLDISRDTCRRILKHGFTFTSLPKKNQNNKNFANNLPLECGAQRMRTFLWNNCIHVKLEFEQLFDREGLFYLYFSKICQ